MFNRFFRVKHRSIRITQQVHLKERYSLVSFVHFVSSNDTIRYGTIHSDLLQVSCLLDIKIEDKSYRYTKLVKRRCLRK